MQACKRACQNENWPEFWVADHFDIVVSWPSMNLLDTHYFVQSRLKTMEEE